MDYFSPVSRNKYHIWQMYLLNIWHTFGEYVTKCLIYIYEMFKIPNI